MQDYDIQEAHDGLVGFAAPSQAETVFGHNSQADFLARAYASGKMHHAFLFDGPPGVGKASLAFIFARHIIDNPDHSKAPLILDGTATSASIRQIAIGAHSQVMHLTRPVDVKTGKHKTQLTIDETRKIGHFLSHTVAGNGYRIVIVDPVNDMNMNAANALLKNLEEPTPRTLFILIAQSSGKLLPTIKSRCLSIRFSGLDNTAMRGALDHIGLKGVTDALIERSNGSPRTAVMMQESGGLDIIAAAEKILGNPQFDASAALKLGEVVATREAEPVYLLLCEYLMDRLSQAATRAAGLNIANSHALANLHQIFGQSFKMTNMYNLDKRQNIVDVIFRLHQSTKL